MNTLMNKDKKFYAIVKGRTNMEIKNVRYYVEWFGKSFWGDYISDEKSFDTEVEAIAFIKNELKPDATIKRATLTSTKHIYFTDED